MPELVGTFGKFRLIGGETRVFEMPTDVVRLFFKDIAIKRTDVAMNDLGLYSFLPVGRDGKAKMAKLSAPRNLFQGRKSCLTWNPKGKMYWGVDEILTDPIEYMGEQCSDAVFGDCLEWVLGTGNDVRDITSTPEGQALFAAMLDRIFLGLGNSFFDILTFGQHQLITDSNTNNWYNKEVQTDDEWDDYVDQQVTGLSNLKGHITIIDESLEAHHNVEIFPDEVSGEDFIGDVVDLFKRVEKNATKRMKTIQKRRRGDLRTVRLVSPGIFSALEDHITATYNTIPAEYAYFLLRNNGDREPIDGIINYKGTPVVCWDELAEFDEVTGTTTHRVTDTVTGNFVVPHDVADMAQFDGMGLRIEHSLRLKDKGATYMSTNLKVGTGIAEPDFVTNASLTLTP